MEPNAHNAAQRPGPLFYLVSAAHITAHTIWNVMLGRFDPNVSFKRFVMGMCKRSQSGTFDRINAQTGHCYTACVPAELACDAQSVSRLRVYEDGRPLGPAHASHHEIREHGQGRFSHWSGYIYFSTPDNTDPRTNGRTYTWRD